jgi:Macrocin-O-methyltransferase (TylF)
VEKINGQLIDLKSAQLIEDYQLLKKMFLEVMQHSGQMWNWPVATGLTRPSIGRILQLNQIYGEILEIPGSICEFGVHFGSSSNILMNLKSLLEPHNSTRNFYLFDTFRGFLGSDLLDGPYVKDADFSVNVEDYEKFLTQLLQLQNRLRNDHYTTSFKIYKGDASETVQNYLDENPHSVISLAIFDMDIYSPTKKVLEKILPRLIKGSVVVFDEFNHEAYPGETIAVMETLGLNGLKMRKSKYVPGTAWFKFH